MFTSQDGKLEQYVKSFNKVKKDIKHLCLHVGWFDQWGSVLPQSLGHVVLFRKPPAATHGVTPCVLLHVYQYHQPWGWTYITSFLTFLKPFTPHSGLCMCWLCVAAGHACPGGCPGQAGHQLAEWREREAGHAGDVMGGTRRCLGGGAKWVSAVCDGTARAMGRHWHTGGLHTALRVSTGEYINPITCHYPRFLLLKSFWGC